MYFILYVCYWTCALLCNKRTKGEKKVALNAPLYQENESILKLYQFHVRNKLLFNHILMMISTPKSVSCSFFARM